MAAPGCIVWRSPWGKQVRFLSRRPPPLCGFALPDFECHPHHRLHQVALWRCYNLHSGASKRASHPLVMSEQTLVGSASLIALESFVLGAS